MTLCSEPARLRAPRGGGDRPPGADLLRPLRHRGRLGLAGRLSGDVRGAGAVLAGAGARAALAGARLGRAMLASRVRFPGVGYLIRPVGGLRHGPPPDSALERIPAAPARTRVWAQLRQVGLSDDEIDGRVRAGSLVRVDRGVYAVGHDDRSEKGLWMTAVLASGRGAVLSHRSAAGLWGVWRGSTVPVDVSVPTQRRSPTGVTVHRSCQLTVGEVTEGEHSGDQTAAYAARPRRGPRSPGRSSRALADADRLGVCTQLQLRAGVRAPGRAGAAILQAVLDEHVAPAHRETGLGRAEGPPGPQEKPNASAP